MPGIIRRLRQFARARRGVAAVEFAIVSVPFLGLLLGICVLAVNFYMQYVLDYALRTAVRQIQLGAVPPGTSASDFTGKVFCPIFGRFAACSSILITVEPVPDYKSAAVVGPPSPAQLATAGPFCVGQPGQLMFARAVYLSPLISQFWPYATQVGTNQTALVATAAFANENPLGAAIPAGGGCA